MKLPYEETSEFYRNLTTHIVGIPKNKTPTKASKNLTDSELVAFYSEKYIDVDVADILLKNQKDRIIGLCNLVKEGEFYLDVGCANGAYMEILRQRGIEGIGLDLSIPNILNGRERNPQLKFIHGFSEEIPFKDGYFDIVLLSKSIGHFRYPKVTVAECLRVAEKCLVVCILKEEELKEKPINPLSEKEILKLLEFYELQIHFFLKDGHELSREEALSKLKNNPEIFIRAEKTPETNDIVKGILNSAGKENEKKAKEEILSTDQWAKDIELDRHETRLARYKLVSNLIEGNRVLEIGCGNGVGSVDTANYGFEVVGIDLSEPGIRQAIEIAAKNNVQEKTKFFPMDATNLLFPDNSFDTIIIPEVLEHIRSPRKMLEEAIRVVRTGGRIIISVPDGLLIPWEGHLRVFFKDTLATELSQYTEDIEWHELHFKKWLICSFFVRKKELGIKEGPSVDIIMPTYNGRKTIRKAIRSVLDQTYKNWNLVVVNDGGEDVSDILNEFHNNRINYIYTLNKGKSHALNIGIEKSDGEYIAYLDDDDILYPIHLEVLIQTALEKKRDFVYTDWYQISIDENYREFKREIAFRLDVTPAMLISLNYIFHNSILHKRSLLNTVGMYDETLSILIDWDMIRRLAFSCKPYHIWSFTCEHFLYYNNGIMQNRITGLWNRSPEKVNKSIETIIEKTVFLKATQEELKEAIIKTMLSMSYYHSLKHNDAIQTMNNQIKVKDARIASLEAIIQSIHQSMIWRSVMKFHRVLEKLLPPGTKRRNYYDMSLLGLRTIANEGWKSFLLKTKYNIRNRNSINKKNIDRSLD